MEKSAENSADEVSTPRLKVKDIAAELGIDRRTLARLAAKGLVPGVVRSLTNKYHFLWCDTPELRAWIEERKRYRKGNRKQKAKRNRQLTTAKKMANKLRRMASELNIYIQQWCKNPTLSQILEIKNAAERVSSGVSGILRRCESEL